VVFVVVGVGHIPKKMARARVQAEQVSVVGLNVSARAPDGNTATMVHGGVVYESFGDRAGVVPEGAARARIEGVSVVSGTHKHHAIDNGWGVLQSRVIPHMKDPLRTQLRNIVRSNFRKRGKAATGVIPVVGS